MFQYQTRGTWRRNRNSRSRRRNALPAPETVRSFRWLWGPPPPPAADQAARRPPSAHAPMDGVPVASQREDEQQEGNQQQAGSFRGINRVPLLLVGRVVLAPSV